VPSFVVSSEIVFGADDERLSLRHSAGGTAARYVTGFLLAAGRARDDVRLKPRPRPAPADLTSKHTR
jgi:4-hydroxy-tetrahydrodipicolinate reductase